MEAGTYKLERKPKGYQQLTVSTTAVALTAPVGATRAVVKVIAQPVRYRNDGTAPTSTVGFPLVANEIFEVDGIATLGASRFIRSAGTDSTLEILYYGS